jgi:hypothetical protein
LEELFTKEDAEKKEIMEWENFLSDYFRNEDMMKDLEMALLKDIADNPPMAPQTE